MVPSRGELAALFSMTFGPAAARNIRYGARFLPRSATVRDLPQSVFKPAPRGTTSENMRGNTLDRRRRKLFLLTEFGDGTIAPCAFCGTVLTFEKVTVDRFPVPGRLGGRYTRDNIRPACAGCNTEDQGRAGVLAVRESVR